MPLIHNPALRPKPIFHPPAVWLNIQSEFIRGEGSTRTLAAKHGVKLSTLQARCKREEWVDLREMRAQDVLDDLTNFTGGELR
jgi:hypothetical protein